MKITCPHCHAEESRCPEVLPACRARGAEMRLLYARANGNDEVAVLRAENERLRLENEMLRLRPVVGEARLRLLNTLGFGKARPWP